MGPLYPLFDVVLGTLSVKDLESTTNCNFSNISCTTNLTNSNNDVTFTGSLKSGITYSLDNGIDITSTAAIISGMTITDSSNNNTATLTITNLQDTLAANLITI